MMYARLMKHLTGIQGRVDVTGEELAPPFRPFCPRAGSGRFTLRGLDGGHFESRRDCGWSSPISPCAPSARMMKNQPARLRRGCALPQCIPVPSTNETESGETCSTTVTGMRWRWSGWSRLWKAWPELLHDAADSG